MPEQKPDKPVRIPKDYYDRDYFTVKGKKGIYNKFSYAINNLFHRDIADMIKEIAEMRAALDNNSKLLDIGCALGNVIHHLGKDGIDGYGVDISDYAIFNSHAPSKVVQADIINGLPYANNEFDFVFSRETLEHIHGYFIHGILKEIFRVLKNGGVAILSPANNTYEKERRKQSEGNPCRDKSHLCIRPPYWWAKMCENAGFYVDYEWSMRAMSSGMPDKYAWTMITAVRR